MIIGIDFDNTIASYNDILHQLALQAGWIDPGVAKDKKEIRNHVRTLSDGEIKWQTLQAEIYGPKINHAKLTDGILKFLGACKARKTDVLIISHKTKFAASDTTKTNLQDAAMRWLESKGIFNQGRTGVKRENVFFEVTREEKIARIKKANCTHFIDDMEEIFADPSFPKNVQPILYHPTSNHWFKILKTVFPHVKNSPHPA